MGTGSYRTPLGTFFVSAKIGDNLPPGAVIKSRLPTREIVTVNAPGRDAIVSRVIWLRGKEDGNRNAHVAFTSMARLRKIASDGARVSAASE